VPPGGWADDTLTPFGPALPLPGGVRACGVVVHDDERAAGVLEGEVVVPGHGPPAGRVAARRRAEFLAGRWCAVRALEAAGGAGPVGRAADGSPVWPRGFVGSITHSHGRVLAVAARATDVAALGIDLEGPVSAEAAAELRPRVLGADEAAVLAAAVGAGAPAFTLGFSAKEALYKALHPMARRFLDFDAARVVAADARTLTLELACDWAPALRRGRRIDLHHARTADRVETLVAVSAGALP
jgi:enterobactin synthetase component D